MQYNVICHDVPASSHKTQTLYMSRKARIVGLVMRKVLTKKTVLLHWKLRLHLNSNFLFSGLVWLPYFNFVHVLLSSNYNLHDKAWYSPCCLYRLSNETYAQVSVTAYY